MRSPRVFDDTTLGVVMKTLDTITDFVSYLDRKERLFASGTKISVPKREESPRAKVTQIALRFCLSSGLADF